MRLRMRRAVAWVGISNGAVLLGLGVVGAPVAEEPAFAQGGAVAGVGGLAEGADAGAGDEDDGGRRMSRP